MDSLEFVALLTVIGAVIIFILAVLYAFYLIYINQDLTINSRELAFWIIFITFASFLSGFLAYYYIHNYSFKEFILSYLSIIGLAFWVSFFIFTFGAILKKIERRFK